MGWASDAYLDSILHQSFHRLDGKLKLARGEAEVGRAVVIGSSRHLD